MVSTARLTLEQFLELPEQKPALEFDACGTISVKMSPNTDHSALQAHLARLLLNWIDGDSGTRRGYLYTELRTNIGGASRLPDVAFYRRKPRESDRKHALEAPDLAVEILSPSDDVDEQRAKCRWYLDQGTRIALLVDPEARTIETFSRESASLAELLPGLRLDPATIFRVLDD